MPLWCAIAVHVFAAAIAVATWGSVSGSAALSPASPGPRPGPPGGGPGVCGRSISAETLEPLRTCAESRPVASETMIVKERPFGASSSAAMDEAGGDAPPGLTTSGFSPGKMGAEAGSNVRTSRMRGVQRGCAPGWACEGNASNRGGRVIVWTRMSPLTPPVTTLHTASCVRDTVMAVTAALCPKSRDARSSPSLVKTWRKPLASATASRRFIREVSSTSLKGSHWIAVAFALAGILSCARCLNRSATSSSPDAGLERDILSCVRHCSSVALQVPSRTLGGRALRKASTSNSFCTISARSTSSCCLASVWFIVKLCAGAASSAIRHATATPRRITDRCICLQGKPPRT
mmetsp:Transcript_49755/g.118417  ORF Transcript_49755/g.118417 Transcript_49755/m.118417 type:complete len:348 (-) Transcript_49755:8-1051(-)